VEAPQQQQQLQQQQQPHPGSAGSYQLLGDVLTRFSDHCPNTVTQTRIEPKDQVQVFFIIIFIYGIYTVESRYKQFVCLFFV